MTKEEKKVKITISMITANDKINVSKRRAALFSAGGLISLPVCLFLFAFFPLVIDNSLPLYAVVIIASVAVILCAFVFPLLYEKVRSSQSITLGRYHLPFALSEIVFSLSIALIFSFSQNRTAQIIILAIALPAAFVSALVIMSALNSIKLRVFGEKNARSTNVFFIAGIILFAVALLVYAILKRDYYSDLGYLFAGINLLACAAVYFSCVPFMPRFIKVEAAQKQSYKQKLGNFYSPLKKSGNRRAYIGFALAIGGIALAFILGYFYLYSEFGALYGAIGVCGAAAAAAVCYGIIKKVYKKKDGVFLLMRRSCGYQYNIVGNLKNMFALSGFTLALNIICVAHMLTAFVLIGILAYVCAVVSAVLIILGAALLLASKKKIAEEAKNAQS